MPYKFCLTTPILLASHLISHQPKRVTGVSPESQLGGTVKLHGKGMGTGTDEAFMQTTTENYFLLSNASKYKTSWRQLKLFLEAL